MLSKHRLSSVAARLLGGLADQKITRKLIAQRPSRNWRAVRWAPPGGGPAERTRRRQQIARGTLNESNGLLRSVEPQR